MTDTQNEPRLDGVAGFIRRAGGSWYPASGLLEQAPGYPTSNALARALARDPRFTSRKSGQILWSLTRSAMAEEPAQPLNGERLRMVAVVVGAWEKGEVNHQQALERISFILAGGSYRPSQIIGFDITHLPERVATEPVIRQGFAGPIEEVPDGRNEAPGR